MSSTSTPPIAIVGIGCRFPGARGPDALWKLVCDGVDAISEVPADRFDIDAYYDPRPATPGKISTRWGGFLEGIDQFDPGFFGISPREAVRMDPQQRVLLEVAWEALEDGGQIPESLTGSKTGVFVGMCSDDYATLQFSESTSIDIYAATGSARSVISGRLSYVFGLKGPSLTVDTACSSSLVAVHLACQSLRSGECTLALAGGVNLILAPEPSMGFSQARMLAPDGRCKAFDARGDGFIRSEGAGIVVLKPHVQALADRDPIYAVILSSAVNNDGRDTGLMTPSSRGQEAMLREAYRVAGVAPSDIHYVEAHGTGTSVGDPVEARALGAVLSEGRPRSRPCLIGSVKTNIGHTEGASGVAGLIKAALALRHRAIPGNLHFQSPNPSIPFEDLGLAVPRELTPWPAAPAPARAAVSSFGISGTNAHVVLEESTPRSSDPEDSDEPTDSSRAELFTLSAHSKEALEALAHELQRQLADSATGSAPSARKLCYTASSRRSHQDHRLALTARSVKEIDERLAAFLQGQARPGMSVGRRIVGRSRKLVFVFPGQGSQWPGMGRTLYANEPVFRAAIDECAAVMQRHCDWSLVDVLSDPEAEPLLERLDVIQPAICGIQIALGTLWRSWGLEPDALVGHSLGEVAAAHMAGILSLEDAARVICLRSRLVTRTSGQGSMAVVALSFDDTQQALAGFEDRAAAAASNGPVSTVISGDRATLSVILERLDRQGVFGRWVKVDYASHSPQMDRLRPELLELLAEVEPKAACIPFHSTVTGLVEDGLALDASYWARNLREPVLFFPAIAQLIGAGSDCFLELSPHPVLVSSIQQSLRHLDREGVALPSLRRDEDEREVLLGSLGAIYAMGFRVNWTGLFPVPGECVRFPAYPWQRKRYWMDPPQPGNGRARTRRGRDARTGAGNFLLDGHVQSALQPGMHLWECNLDSRALPILQDHRIAGRSLVPAAVAMEAAMAAATEILGAGSYRLEDVRFKKALFLSDELQVRVQTTLTVESPDLAAFQILSLQAPSSWVGHVAGTVRRNAQKVATRVERDTAPRADLLREIQDRCTQVISGEALYQDLRRRGYEYGPSLQRVTQIFRRRGEALGQLQPLDAGDSAESVLPAGALDAAFQVTLATLLENRTDCYVPVQLERLVMLAKPEVGEALWSHARIRGDVDANSERIVLDIDVLDSRGGLVTEAVGLTVQRFDRVAASDKLLEKSVYSLSWQARSLASQSVESSDVSQSPASWLIFGVEDELTASVCERLNALGHSVSVVTLGERYESVGGGAYRVRRAASGDLEELLDACLRPDSPPLLGVIHLWSLMAKSTGEATVNALDRAQELGCFSVLHLTQALVAARLAPVPRLFLVTRGAVAAGPDLAPISMAQASVWGLGRVISHEHPEFRCTKVDLSPRPDANESELLVQELLAADVEDQIAIRGAQRLAARLEHPPSSFPRKRESSGGAGLTGAEAPLDPRESTSFPRTRESRTQSIGDQILRPRQFAGHAGSGSMRFSGTHGTERPRHEVPDSRVRGNDEQGRLAASSQLDDRRVRGDDGVSSGLGPAVSPGASFRLEVDAPGRLDSLIVRACGRLPPGPGEVEIEVFAAGLNFSDVLKALGLYPGLPPGPVPLGIECSGVVSAMGDGVRDLSVGDAVIAIAPNGFSRWVSAPASLVARKPEHLSFEHAASIPIAYLTAFYSLEHLGRMAAGERILIHAAAGGVGLAAVELARAKGAEVYATAGTPEKREFLRSLGVPHVMDSRSLRFAEEILDITRGEGVDLVLNSLAGEALERSLSVLGPYGRFLEIGKRDIYENSRVGLSPFRQNLSFFAIDLDRLFRERTELASSLFRHVVGLVANRTASPMPVQTYSLADAQSAFRSMAQARHIGKIVLTLKDQLVDVAPAVRRAASVRSDATYLITGGLGGLGLAVARWLVGEGARHLALLGRSSVSAAQESALEELRRSGARILTLQADVSSSEQLGAALARMRRELPPLRGVIHAAGILDDGILLQQTRERFRTVMAPKMAGSWLLHQLTSGDPIEIFVLFSSAASLLGSPGQANYSAANAFLDALAHHRRSLCLPALSINWGPWSEVGLAARPDRGGRLAYRGFESLTPEQGTEVFGRLLSSDHPQVAVLPVDWEKWREFYPMAGAEPFFESIFRELASQARPAPADSSLESVLRSPADRRSKLIETFLGEQLAKVLGFSGAAPAKLDVDQPLSSFGLDSLMAVELKNRVEAGLGVAIPVATLLQGPSIAQMASEVGRQLWPPPGTGDPEQTHKPDRPPSRSP